MPETGRNRQYEAMLAPAQARLMRYGVGELCENGGLDYDADRKVFALKSLGSTVHVALPDFTVSEDLDMWYVLTLLQYMDTADGTPLSGRTVALTELRGGLARGASFDREIDAAFAKGFAGVTCDEFADRCRRLGGTVIGGKADVTAVLSYAPRFPVTLCFWEGDDEFPASGKALVDAAAEHYLTLEAAGSACLDIVQRLAE